MEKVTFVRDIKPGRAETTWIFRIIWGQQAQGSFLYLTLTTSLRLTVPAVFTVSLLALNVNIRIRGVRVLCREGRVGVVQMNSLSWVFPQV